MSRTASVPDRLRSGPFTLAQARDSGVSRRSLQGRAYRRLSYGIYVAAGVELDREVWIAAATLGLPAGSAVSGLWAAWVWGVDLLPPTERDVEITVPRSSRVDSRPGVVVRRALLPMTEIVFVDGVQVTDELRTAFDLARHGRRDDAVVALDAMRYARLISRTGLQRYIAAHRGWRGVRSAADHLALSVDRAESPMETRLRLVLLDGGLPPPVVNESVCDARGRFIARPDLRIGRVIVEFDGAVHRTAQRHREDLRRQNALI